MSLRRRVSPSRDYFSDEVEMRRINFIWVYHKGEFQLGLRSTWQNARENGVELVLMIGFWSVGVGFLTGRSLAERMIKALKQL